MAKVTDEDNKVNTYTGLTRNTFKKRFNGHTYTFNHRDAPSTTLNFTLASLKIYYRLGILHLDLTHKIKIKRSKQEF